MAQVSPDPRNAHHHFSEIARLTANALGSPWAFALG
jgi:hypothetical protein